MDDRWPAFREHPWPTSYVRAWHSAGGSLQLSKVTCRRTSGFAPPMQTTGTAKHDGKSQPLQEKAWKKNGKNMKYYEIKLWSIHNSVLLYIGQADQSYGLVF